MKSKHLANVLIKIIGLYVCLCSIPGYTTGLAAILEWGLKMHQSDDFSGRIIYYLMEAVGAIVQSVVGILLIIKSRKLAEFWFKNEDE